MSTVSAASKARSESIDATLQITGLTLLFLTLWVMVCAYEGRVPAVTDSEVPSRLFSWGGVFGMHRPMVEVAWRTTCAGLFGLGALGICDILYARHTKARYFALHVICNAWITILCAPDLYNILCNPMATLTRRETTNHWPTSLVFSIHFYHMLFFRNLAFIDWLHHILMVVVGAPLLITGEAGALMNFNHFFMCGVPGGLDYAMLFAVKHGWMKPLAEKKVNAAVNVWVREPALVCTATLGYIQLHEQASDYPGWVTSVRIFLMFLACWNGLFFMERVVGNYHVCAYKERERRKEEKKGDAHKDDAQKNDSIYESEEHFSTSLPGMGMRISVSKADLTQLQAQEAAEKKANGTAEKKANGSASSHEAYPVSCTPDAEAKKGQ